MKRLFLLILFVASCHSQGDKDRCQGLEKPPNPTSGCCGKHLSTRNEYETNNGDAAGNQFPWLALIENESGDRSYTGVLISSRHVLTTAQVDLFDFYMVRLGVSNQNQTALDCAMIASKQICHDGSITIEAISMKSNRMEPNHNGVYSDIAVMLLIHDAPYNEFIRPICLPTKDFLDSTPFKYHFINAGWSRRTSNGEHEIGKHYVILPHVRYEECQKAYNSVLILIKEICAGVRGHYRPFNCNENEGSPYMIIEKGQYTLLGITSYGSLHCGILGAPDVFTKVYPYLSWINQVVDELLEESLNPFGL